MEVVAEVGKEMGSIFGRDGNSEDVQRGGIMLLTHHVLTLPPKLRYDVLYVHVLLQGKFVPRHHLLILMAYLYHEHLDLCLLV